MKRILVTENVATMVKKMRNDENGEWSAFKVDLADSFSELAMMLSVARCDDSGELAASADGIIRVMETLANYNNVLNTLYEHSEGKKASYSIDVPKLEATPSIPNEKMYEALKQIFDEHPEAMKNLKDDVDALTIGEAAEILGMSVESLEMEIFNVMQNGKL